MKINSDYNLSVFSKILSWFKVYYIFYLILAFNAFFNASPVLDVLTYATAIIGSSLALCQIILYRETLKTKFFWIQIAFIFSYILSSAVNIAYGYIDNVKTVIWTVLPLVLLYSNSFLLSEDNQKSDFKAVSIAYIVPISLNNIFSISMMFWGYMYNFIDQTGTSRAIGFRWDRLWGVYDDPNHGATISVVAVLLALYLYKLSVKRPHKILYVLSIVTQILYIILSDSRTGLIALIVGLAIWGVLNFKPKKLMKYRWSSVLITAAMIILLLLGDVGIKSMYEKDFFVNFIKVTRVSTARDMDENKSESARKKDTEDNATSGRMSIWSSGLEIFNSTPVVGTSYRNLTNYALANKPDTYIVKTDWMHYDSMHNMPLDVLVSQGIVGIVIFGVFGVMAVIYLIKKKAWRYLYKSPLFTCGATVMITMLISSMFMSIIYFVHCPQTYMFWLSFGVCVSIIERDSKRAILSD